MVQLAPEKWQASRAHVPSLPLHNQSVVDGEGWACPPPSIAAFANGLAARAMTGSRRLGGGGGGDFNGGGFFLFRYISCLAAFNEVLSF